MALLARDERRNDPDNLPLMHVKGLSASVSIVVGENDTAVALGSGDVEVLATPRIVALVEAAAVAALRGALDAVDTSVGTRIDLRHIAPSLVGAEVTARAEVTAHQGRKVVFAVEATMGDQRVAFGTHDRAIVKRASFPG